MKLWLIAKSNMKKKKGNVVILFVLVMVATMLLYTACNVLGNIGSFLDEKNESLNGAHTGLVSTTGHDKEIKEIFHGLKDFDYMEMEDYLQSHMSAKVKNETQDDEEETMDMMMFDYGTPRKISQLKVIDAAAKMEDNSIVVPEYVKVAKGYKTGDIIRYKFGERTYRYKIYGFTEDVMFSTPSNITVYKCFVSNKEFTRLQKNEPALRTMRYYRAVLTDDNSSEESEEKIEEGLNQKIKDPNFETLYIINYTTMKMGTSMMISVMMAILAVFSVLIILIAMIVIRFSIVSNIQDNLANVGILEAVGYTSSQLARAAMLEYIIISVLGIISGLALSIGCSRFIAGVVSGSIGLEWIPKQDFTFMCSSILVVFGMILAILLVTARKYKKISPLEALRGGIATHSFQRNSFPLAKTRMGVNTAIGMKGIFHNKKQNISIAIIVALLSFTCVSIFGLYYNFAVDKSAMINLVGIEKPNVAITYIQEKGKESQSIQDIQKQVEARSEVKKTLTRRDSINVTFKKGTKESNCFITVFDDVKKMTTDNMLRGRRPTAANEIEMSNVDADDFGVKVGDSITASIGTRQETYVIVGIHQQISNMGHGIYMNEAGVKKLDPSYSAAQIFIYLKDGVDSAKETKALLEEYKDTDAVQATNFDESYDTVLGSFIGVVSIMCTVFAVITVLVISLIIILITRMKLVREKRSMGVFKAIGFTTRQIIWQTVMNFAPVILFGSAIGAVLGKFLTNRLFTLVLSFSGIEKCQLTVSSLMILAIFAGISAIAFLIAFLFSVGIRKIEPYRMIVEG